jgi:lysophospholipase L1-like esterase
MKKINLMTILVALCLIAVTSCTPTIDTPIGTGSLGTLVNSGEKVNYVAVGNSITAGYQDGGVYSDGGNDYSFPNQLAQKFGMTEFNQPDIAGEGLGIRMKLKGFDATGNPIIVKTLLPSATINNIGLAKPFNNLGVPGAVAYDLLDTSSFLVRSQTRQNPYYANFLRNPLLGASMLDQAIKLQPNVVTVEIGANDVLGYATSGGTISTTYLSGKAVPTPAAAMTQIYQGAIMKLKIALPNAKIIVMTVPDVMGVPFFNVVAWNRLALDSNQAKALTAAYGGLAKFSAGSNGFIASDPSSTYKMRQLTKDDKVLLTIPTDSIKLAGWGSLKPIPKQYVLFKEEIAIIKQAVADYNTAINGLTALTTNVKVFDMNKVFSDILTLKTDGTYQGYAVPASTTMKPSFISGEMFSLDGIHPTSRGYGAITNEILKFINLTYGADLPLVRVQNLPAVTIYK